MLSSRWFRLAVSFGLSVFFLYLTLFIPHPAAYFRGEMSLGQALAGQMRIHPGELGGVLRSAAVTPIVWGGVLFFLTLVIRAWRWELMLKPLVKISFKQVFSAMSIGYMANNVLPLRMGEVYRAHVIFEMTGMPRSTAFGSIVLERVMDLISMLPFLGLAVILFPLPAALRAAAFGVVFAGFVIFGLLLYLTIAGEKAIRPMQRLLPPKVAHGVMALLDKFTTGLVSLRKSRHLTGLIISSLVLWVGYGGMDFCILKSLGFMNGGFELIDRNPLGAVLVTLMVTTLGFSIPGAPGAVGTYHGMAVLGLGLFGIPADEAAGFAILLHALNYIPLTGLGLIFFWHQGLSFKETKQIRAEEKELKAHSDLAGSAPTPVSAGDSGLD